MTTAASDEDLATIKRVLDVLGIKRFFVVDDAYDMETDAQLRSRLLTHVDQLRRELTEFAIDRPDLEITEEGELLDQEFVKEALERHWASFDSETVAAFRGWIEQLEAQKTTGATQDPFDALDLLPTLIPEGIDYRPLSVSAWRAEGAQLVSDGGNATLVMFDWDLGEHGGTRGGETLIHELDGAAPDNVIYGLFTNEAANVSREIEIAEQIAGDRAPELPYISVLAKNRTQSALEFAEGLRLFLHTRDLQDIKRHTLEVLGQAHSAVVEYVAKIGNHSLMASAEAARSEGEHEADGVFRIAQAHLRRQLIERFRIDTPLVAIERVRKAASFELSVRLPPSQTAATYEWNERFDSGEFLLRCRRPLELGDIFRVAATDGAESYFMLLVQPCDLMVRSEGKRSNKQAVFTLVEVKELPPGSEAAASDPESEGRWVRIGRFKSDSPVVWGVNMGQRLYVAPEVLDSCVLSDDGSAVLYPAIAADPTMSAGWQKMPAKLNAWRSDRVKAGKDVVKMLPAEFEGREEVVQAIYLGALGENYRSRRIAAAVNESTGRIQIEIRRECRLVEAQARAVIQRWAAHLGRPDSPGDLYDEEYEESAAAPKAAE